MTGTTSACLLGGFGRSSVVLLVAGHARPAPVSAQASAVAERFFSASSVPAGGDSYHQFAPRRYGYFAQVVETLPTGFSCVRSTQPGVEVNGQEVTITLLKNDTVTCTVTAPSAAGDAVFSGVLTDPLTRICRGTSSAAKAG